MLIVLSLVRHSYLTVRANTREALLLGQTQERLRARTIPCHTMHTTMPYAAACVVSGVLLTVGDVNMRPHAHTVLKVPTWTVGWSTREDVRWMYYVRSTRSTQA